MKIQVNSDKNVHVDASVMSFVRAEANRALQRFKPKLTRVEFHLSDVNSHKFGRLDKRCLIEVRPAGQRPLAIKVASPDVPSAVRAALSKARTALDSLFGRLESRRAIPQRLQSRLAVVHANSGKPVAKRAAAVAKPAKRATTKKIAAKKSAAKRTIAKKTVARKAVSETTQAATHRPKKKGIYQARRKSWPARRAA